MSHILHCCVVIQDIARVLNTCCHLVPLQCDTIVLKLCQLIHSTLNSQQVFS